jgi:hypothetical protein
MDSGTIGKRVFPDTNVAEDRRDDKSLLCETLRLR